MKYRRRYFIIKPLVLWYKECLFFGTLTELCDDNKNPEISNMVEIRALSLNDLCEEL